MDEAISLYQRVTKVETLLSEQAKDITEIKMDVKTILQAKYRSEGQTAGISAVVAAVVAAFGWFFK